MRLRPFAPASMHTQPSVSPLLTPRRRLAMTAVGAALLLSAASAGAQAPSSREPYRGLDAYVDATLATWKVPGAAIAIVRHDSVIFAKGYGVRQLGKADRTTERTIFAIGSASKAFTAAAAAMLVDEKKLALDAPATTYLPSLQLFDSYATRELTIRDLLSHRSGLARGDPLWYGTEFDRDEILRRVRFLPPSTSFRSQFGYQNLMYLAAGQIVARAAGATWDEVVRDRIFAPLGMTSSSTTIRALQGVSDVAAAHAEIDDTLRVIPWRNIDNIGPAGSINSHVVDMAQWIRLQLGKGRYGGRQLISEQQMEEMRTPHTVIRLDTAARRLNPHSHLEAYGLGWFLQDYRGRLLVEHGGNIDGFSALVAMLPEEQVGVVILTNLNSTPMPRALMYRILDHHLGVPPRNWSADMREQLEAQRGRAREARQKLLTQRVANTRPSLALDEYGGTFADSMYGEVRVRVEGGTLRIDRGPAFQGTLEHWHFDTFRTAWSGLNLARSFVTFRLNALGKADELLMDMGGAPVIFRRRPEPASRAVVAPVVPR